MQYSHSLPSVGVSQFFDSRIGEASPRLEKVAQTTICLPKVQAQTYDYQALHRGASLVNRQQLFEEMGSLHGTKAD